MRHSSEKQPIHSGMRDSAQSPLQRRAADHATEAAMMHEPPGLLSPGSITALQRSIGNQGVQRLLRTGDAAPSNIATAVVQRKPVRVPRGSSTSSAWKFIKTEGAYDIYDDGLPETEIDKLAPSRWAIEDFDDALSDAELSDTEIDLSAKSGKKKVYRVKDVREAQKVVKNVMRKDPHTSIAVRTDGSDTVFRLEGRGTQFFVKTVASGALKQSDGSMAKGAMPPLATGDPKATGKLASYEHVASELRDYDSAKVADAIYNKYFKQVPYPTTFSVRARAKMDELFVILAMAEPFRADYAIALLVAAIKALQNGESMEAVLYKGKGQLEALHVGASSHKDSGVSGQLMEQNMGKGRNDPHPTQKSMSISDTQFNSATKRTRDLFTKAASDTPFDEFLVKTLVEPTRALKKTKTGPGTTATVTPLSAMGPISGVPAPSTLTSSGASSLSASAPLSMGTPPSSGLSSMPAPLSTGLTASASMLPPMASPFSSFPPLSTGTPSFPFLLPPLSSLFPSFSPFGVAPASLPPLMSSGPSSLSSPPMPSGLSSLPLGSVLPSPFPSGSVFSPSQPPVSSLSSPLSGSPALPQPTSSLLGPSSAFASASVSPPPPLSSTMAIAAIDSIVQSEQKPRGHWKVDKVVKLVSSASGLSVGQQVQYKGVTYTVKSITATGLVTLKR